MEEEKDIFDLSVAKDEDKFVKKSLKLESEVVSDILEQMKVFPWLGSLIKLGMVGKGFLDLRFVRKIGRFLQPSNDIAQERKEDFLEMAYGWLMEVSSQFEIAEELGYINNADRKNMDVLIDEVARLISGLQKSFKNE